MIYALGACLSPDKVGYPDLFHVLPSINVLCHNSIEAWMDLRSLILNFGLRYQQRIILYSTVLLMFYISFATIMLLNLFGVVDLSLSSYLQMASCFDILVVLFTFMFMFYYGVKINEVGMKNK